MSEKYVSQNKQIKTNFLIVSSTMFDFVLRVEFAKSPILKQQPLRWSSIDKCFYRF